ncbi:heavy-metal-associated domain-containing protein [Candidatus Hakubella thermalkaliphila]|uniref:Copper chaperone CopZ n=1 Tax=Candidatus Hakubella thermalkaliphila TaxID=2754717 RepID=A0A6V8PGR2_9ACTN|nr:heavy metal-associated domain-containing protein [Candidatus Hakubella thermalkaliphila]GFP30116.1 P-type Cu+ transporter [Candidatus Hakubella thermalkaliphila]
MNGHRARLFTIKNMDCTDCALKIEKAVSKLPGVKLAEVSFVTSKLKVVSETPQLNDQAIIKTIKDLGYSAQTEESFKTITFHIEGMDCPDESEIIKRR